MREQEQTPARAQAAGPNGCRNANFGGKAPMKHPPPLSELSVPQLVSSAADLLHQLGVTENYKGFRYAAYAAALCAVDRDRLLLVTKRLYPDVAAHFGVSWPAVERDLRTVVDVAWKCSSSFLSLLFQVPLTSKPTCAQFLAVLSRCMISREWGSAAPVLENRPQTEKP